MALNREYTGFLRKIIPYFNVSVVIWIFFYILDIQSYFGFFIDAAQFRMMTLGLLVVLTFLYYPIKRSKKDVQPIRWYDLAFIALTLVGCLYAVILWPQIRNQFTPPTTLQVVLGFITIVMILEATRRSVGSGISGRT